MPLVEVYRRVRRVTVALAEPLAVEDQVVQTMTEVSPTKWHLAHTSWFFETFVLRPSLPGYRPLDERYATLFNSYYHAAGDRHPQPLRGHLSRPTVAEVLAYRRHVDAAMDRFFADPAAVRAHAFVVELGINHEEQHQELILTDVKHVLAQSPLEPVYARAAAPAAPPASPLRFVEHAGGVVDIGHDGRGFAFDNEGPRHRQLLEPHALASRPVTCGEYLAFIEDRGYERPELWLSDGWDACQRLGWSAPLYWKRVNGGFRLFTLHGARDLNLDEPVCHVSHYEADAYARWAGARLPREAEIEVGAPWTGPSLESGTLHPAGDGGVWAWTESAYLPYPRFRPFPGALGEYNGKFMSGKMVLRGGSCFTPRRHLRATYRNFFVPETRWQMSGIRLARDLA